MIPGINEEANKENIKIFKRYGIRDSSVKRHTCVLCNKKVSIDESSSNNGSRLICNSCSYKYFGKGYGIDTIKRRNWMNDK